MQRLVTGLIGTLLLTSIAANIWLGLFFISSMNVGPIESSYQSGETLSRIVIVPIRGTIDESTAQFVRRALMALRDNKPAAIILRVETGGGGVGASDRIYHELKIFRDETGIPIVASFGDYAASGGYYVSALSDHIYAEPSTITGSIGVMLMDFSVEQLLKNIGVQPTLITATASTEKDIANNPFRDWNERDTQAVQPLLDSMQKRFARVVFEGRSRVVPGYTQADVDKAATGRAFMAEEAIALKLVDEEGYLDAAILKAAALAKLDPAQTPTVTQISEGHGLLSRLGVTQRDVPVGAIDSQRIRSLLSDLTAPQLEYQWRP